MRKKSIIAIAVTAAIVSINANALDLGDALKVMKELNKKAVVPVARPQNPDAINISDTNQSMKLTSEQYCDVIASNEIANAYANALQKALDAGLPNPQLRHLDSKDFMLTKWVEKQIGFLEFKNRDIPNSYANACAYKLKDTVLLNLFTPHPDTLRDELKEYEAKAPQRDIDKRGNIVEKQASIPSDFLHYYSDLRPRIAQVYIFAFPEGPQILKQISSGAAAELEASTSEYVASMNEMKKRDQFAELKKQKEAAEWEQKLEEERQQKSTPDGMLQSGYAAFQVVEKCYQVRDGYQLIYISDPEYNSAKKQVKQIENKLKTKVKATPKALWAKATDANLGTEYPYLSGISFDHGKQFCTLNRSELEIIASRVSGATTLEKSF